ncbi:hypothetical protein OV207_04200 [Corallococcus sp. BB11-1]|uniref:hypothetical protein n=1 Tax=Corallococcus sp. BB11-1 TaxID=2996783 RepID=UPI0010D70465|nr:hypothetical protein [Corallococcus sp. BB11-1]MCY1030649.1 hypothetical protein [Corallococcus sp. BB11-1]RYZ44208.1 MAG: hypothetical protein EOO72_06500 [Myxococcaceae bacterium]
MFRTLALTSAAALSLVCAACGGGDDEDTTPELKDTRSNVSGTHPVQLSLIVTGVPEATDPIATTLAITEEANSKTDLRFAIVGLDCDLTGAMTGESTFKVNPGSCDLAFPTEGGEGEAGSCSVQLSVTQGTGGRESGAKLQATLSGTYSINCSDVVPFPLSLPLTIEIVGT